jgi:hypothetical protein
MIIKFNDIEDIRSAICDIVTYVNSLKQQDLTDNVKCST